MGSEPKNRGSEPTRPDPVSWVIENYYAVAIFWSYIVDQIRYLRSNELNQGHNPNFNLVTDGVELNELTFFVISSHLNTQKAAEIKSDPSTL